MIFLRFQTVERKCKHIKYQTAVLYVSGVNIDTTESVTTQRCSLTHIWQSPYSDPHRSVFQKIHHATTPPRQQCTANQYPHKDAVKHVSDHHTTVIHTDPFSRRSTAPPHHLVSRCRCSKTCIWSPPYSDPLWSAFQTFHHNTVPPHHRVSHVQQTQG